jgi:hypothetical protein
MPPGIGLAQGLAEVCGIGWTYMKRNKPDQKNAFSRRAFIKATAAGTGNNAARAGLAVMAVTARLGPTRTKT